MQHPRRNLAEGIRKHGFRKWYERELLSGHAHMVLCLLCVIGLVGALEAFHRADADARALNAAIMVLCGGLGLWAMRRYLYLLMHAEAVAHQATCANCGTYGRLRLVAQQPLGDAARVCCHHCQHIWTLEP